MNVLAALAAPGTTPKQPLTWWAAPRPWESEDLLGFLQHTLPGDGQRPRVVVLDNASIHRSTTIREAREDLAEQHLIHLWYLPPYSPELNDIERTFRQAKHEGMPRRTQPHERALLAAVHACFGNLRDKLLP